MVLPKKSHKRKPSRESVSVGSSRESVSVGSMDSRDCYDDSNSIVAEEARGHRRRANSSPSTTSKSSRRGRKQRRGKVTKTILGPVAALTGGRREWSKMKKLVRKMVAGDEDSSMPVHGSVLV